VNGDNSEGSRSEADGLNLGHLAVPKAEMSIRLHARQLGHWVTAKQLCGWGAALVRSP
jgi:hypothetical protein